MASTLTQAQVTALYAAASEGGQSGPYAETGTNDGTIGTGLVSSNFEKAIVCLIAVVEFLIANTADPSSSAANATKAGQQRKMLKEALAKAAMRIKPASGGVDDRTTYAATIASKMIAQYNYDNRPDTL